MTTIVSLIHTQARYVSNSNAETYDDPAENARRRIHNAKHRAGDSKNRRMAEKNDNAMQKHFSLRPPENPLVSCRVPWPLDNEHSANVEEHIGTA